jgi:hypothetical protein
MSPIGYARTAAGTFAAEAIFPIVHRLTGSAYNGFSHVHDVVIDTGLAVVWITAALVGFLRRPSNGPAFLLAGASVSLIHGFMFSVATCDRGPIGAGIPFLAAGAAQLYLIAHAFPAFAQRAERREVAAPREAEAPPQWHLGRLWLRPRHSH